ncbi:hypothetical protein Ais01nite_19410 [Asanoa ishikariensis]|uniref:Anti-sigma factor antagonist n=1 Tax=Asanoa ishikariensis TaxID=137265 RepID=A0A1H3UBJ6_9ACTN|nr:STAS domain-containing protein [Asanoa ishikariensis]GIF63906.1 hypothetical protein Ais01nite_19410 [Asanoa ishikariensis]SDZ59766.1 stage II sporulation protein AA (anti-sigma F factor antagonist) [Asanoa ishikariensis]
MTSASHEGAYEVLDLFIERYVDENALTVAVAGEVDLDTAGRLEDALQDGIDNAGVTKIVVDLAGVPFLDSTGIRVLLAGRHRAAECGTALIVTRAQPVVRRVLEVMGVFTLLTTDPQLLECGSAQRTSDQQKAG